MVRTCKALVAFALATLVAGAAVAQNPDGAVAPTLPVTMAWRHVISGGANPATAGQMAVDGSGYNYLLYTLTGGSGTTSYVMKLGPANSTEFNNAIEFISNVVTYTPNAIVINPKVTRATVQNVYMITTVASAGSSYLRVDRLNTNGVVQPGSPFDLSSSPFNTFVAAAATATDLYIVADTSNGVSHELVLFDYNNNSSGSASSTTISTIQPTAAQFDPGTNSWFITGLDTSDATGLSSIWGSYNAANGTKNFGGNLLGSGDPVSGPFTRFRYYADLLPGNRFALSTDQTDDDGAGTESSSFSVRVADTATNTQQFLYPTTGLGSTFGSITQVGQFDTSSPIYGLGMADSGVSGFPLQFLIGLNSSGTLLFNHSEQPIDHMFPMADGFWDLFNWPTSNSVFLEHFFSGNFTYTWGKQYSSPTTQNPIGRLTQFQNEIYVSHDAGNDIWIDRFITGTTINDVTCPASLTGGTTLQVLVNLNRAVLAGETVTIALNSNSPNVLMPNGTQSQNFTLNPGQAQLIVNCSTAAGSYPFKLLAINQGVRRTVASQAN